VCKGRSHLIVAQVFVAMFISYVPKSAKVRLFGTYVTVARTCIIKYRFLDALTNTVGRGCTWA